MDVTLNTDEDLPQRLMRGLEKLRSFAETPRGERTKDLSQRISVEFTRLFRGIEKGRPPPYQSVYTEGGTLYGNSTVQVASEYRRFGLVPREEYVGEPPDHIALEFFFMSYLSSKEAEAWSQDEDERANELLSQELKFLEKHILPWIPRLCRNIRRWDRVGFYSAVADITEAWTQLDRIQIVELTKG